MAHPRMGATTWKWGQTYRATGQVLPQRKPNFGKATRGFPPPSVEGQQEPAEPSGQRAQPRLKRGASCLATLLPEGQPQRPFGPGCREPSGASAQKSLKKRCPLQVRPQPLPCSGCRPADGTAAHSSRKARSPGFPRGRLGLRHRPRAGPRSCRTASPAGSQTGRREAAQPGGPPERRPRPTRRQRRREEPAAKMATGPAGRAAAKARQGRPRARQSRGLGGAQWRRPPGLGVEGRASPSLAPAGKAPPGLQSAGRDGPRRTASDPHARPGQPAHPALRVAALPASGTGGADLRAPLGPPSAADSAATPASRAAAASAGQ